MAVGTNTGAAAPNSDQNANTFFSGAPTGAAAAPTFRAQVIADLPINIPNINLANSGSNEFNGLLELGGAFKGYTLGNPILTNGAFLSPVNQRVYYTPVYVPKAATINGLFFMIAVSGVYVSTGYNGFGLYSINTGTATLTQIAATTTSTTIWAGAVSPISVNFAAPVAVTEGVYYVAHIYQNSSQTTSPQILASNLNSGTAILLGALAANVKLMGSLNAQTILPATQAMTGLSATTTLTWLYLI